MLKRTKPLKKLGRTRRRPKQMPYQKKKERRRTKYTKMALQIAKNEYPESKECQRTRPS